MLPPSINEVYMTVRANKATLRILTPVGRRFKNEAEAHLARTYPTQLAKMRPNFPYALFFRFNFLKINNAGWKTGTAARYKRFDVSNRIKVLEDSLSDVCSVDDSNFTFVSCEKVQGPEELTEIYIWNLDEEESPIYAATTLCVRQL